jgi:hypothetical protein
VSVRRALRSVAGDPARSGGPVGTRGVPGPQPAAAPASGAFGRTARRRRGLVAVAVAHAGAWLVEPVEPGEPSREPLVAAPPPRVVIAVFGLARRCGVTVVSRALAAELASRDPAGAAAVHCDARAAGIPLATTAAGQLARALAELPGTDARAVGRLCLVGGSERTALTGATRELAPLVLDAGSSALGGTPAALADRVVLVGAPSVEPALAGVAADCLARLGHAPLVVLNRVEPSEASDDGARGDSEGRRVATWLTRGVHRLPDSRMGAQLALGGREARGELGRAIAELADLCEVRG